MGFQKLCVFPGPSEEIDGWMEGQSPGDTSEQRHTPGVTWEAADTKWSCSTFSKQRWQRPDAKIKTMWVNISSVFEGKSWP